MPTETTGVPTAEAGQAARQRLYNGVYAETFFRKLARDHNVIPQTTEEQEELLKMASSLRAAHDQEVEKTASNSTSFLKQANAHLEQALGTTATNPVVGVTDEGIKAAAAQLVQNPNVRADIMTHCQLTAAEYGQQPAAT